jgi:hypothetical protein
MLNDNERSSENQSLENLLGAFAPQPAEIDRDQLMFQAGFCAGQAAVAIEPKRSFWQSQLWPVLATASTLAAMVLGILAWQRPERIVVVERPTAAPPQQAESRQTVLATPDEPTSPDANASGSPPGIDPTVNYLLQRDLVLRDGLDALSHADAAGSSYYSRATPTQRQLLQELPGEFRRQTVQLETGEWWQPWLISGDRS